MVLTDLQVFKLTQDYLKASGLPYVTVSQKMLALDRTIAELMQELQDLRNQDSPNIADLDRVRAQIVVTRRQLTQEQRKNS